MSTPMIYINGTALPYPSRGLLVQRQQFVDSARNALGQVVAQKINRRIIKLDALKWAWLTASDWHNILVEIEKFEGVLTWYNVRTQAWEDIRVYWGDATEEVWKVNPTTGVPTEYANCVCNLIDMGYDPE